MALHTDNMRILADYSALRSYSRFDSPVFVTDQGVFYPKTTGTEDGGVVIRSTFDVLYRWHRVVEGGVYDPQWWVIGDVTTTNDEGVIVNSGDQLIACANVAGEGDTILINGTYSIDFAVPLAKNMIITGGGTIKRNDEYSSTLTADYIANATTISVTDASGFRVGQKIWIGDGSEPNGGIGEGEGAAVNNSVVSITAINANVLTVSISGTTTGITAANGTVYTVTDIFDPAGVPDNYRVENIVIDGNKANNSVRSWRVNQTFGEAGTGDTYGTWDNVRFINLPSENYIGPAAKFYGCYFENLEGSILHASNGLTTPLNPFIVHGCYGEGFCLATDAVNGHNEGAFTQSAAPLNLMISNTHLANGSESIFGGIGGDNINIFCSNSSFKDFASFLGTSTAPSVGIGSGSMENLRIENNVFDNCGDFIIIESGAATLAEGAFFDAITFSNNTVYNGRFVISSAVGAVITGNRFLYRPNRGNFTTFSSAVIASYPMYIGIQSCDRIRFSHNIIEGPEDPNSSIETGIYLPTRYLPTNTGMFRNTAPATPSSTLYAQGVDISHNFLFGFTKGIAGFFGTEPGGYNHEGTVVGWNISNNTIITDRSGTSNYCYGIIAEAGTVVDNNIIYFTEHTGTPPVPCAGIMALGVDTGTTDADEIMGCIVTNNKIFGPTDNVNNFSILVGSSYNASGRCAANCVLTNNMGYSNPVVEFPTTHASHEANNIILSSTLLTEFVSPIMPQVGAAQEDTGNY